MHLVWSLCGSYMSTVYIMLFVCLYLFGWDAWSHFMSPSTSGFQENVLLYLLNCKMLNDNRPWQNCENLWWTQYFSYIFRRDIDPVKNKQSDVVPNSNSVRDLDPNSVAVAPSVISVVLTVSTAAHILQKKSHLRKKKKKNPSSDISHFFKNSFPSINSHKASKYITRVNIILTQATYNLTYFFSGLFYLARINISPVTYSWERVFSWGRRGWS